MPDKNLKDLPIELVQQVSSFLDYKSIAGASKISKDWQTLFNDNDIWKYQLKKEFGIENDQFSQFEKIIKKPNYKQLYSRFHYLSQQRNLPNFIKKIYRDKTQHHLVLLSCTDNVTYLKNIPHEQQYIIAVLGTYSGCFDIPSSFLEKHYTKKLLENLFNHATISGNTKLVQYMLSEENKFELEPYEYTLKCAAKSGNLPLVQYLLSVKKKFGLEFGLEVDVYTLNWAAKSGNIQLFQYLLNSKNKLALRPNHLTLNAAARSGNLQLVQYLLNRFGLKPDKDTLNNACQSGNLQLAQHLLNPENKFGLMLDDNTLNRAAFSGNLQLVKNLMNPENKFELEFDVYTLSYAAKSGNLQLVQYLLSAENKFGLESDVYTLNCAARSGNLQLVQYILNSKNKLELRPNYLTLNAAAGSGNLQLVQYLLNPNNKFGLKPDKDTLNNASQSGNLPLVQYLLNPENNFDLVVNRNTLSEVDRENFALSEYLLPCHMAIQQALVQLQAHDITAAKIFLQQSHTACSSHHNMVLQYIVNNPQRFNLNEDAIQCLNEHVNALRVDEKMSTGVSLNF